MDQVVQEGHHQRLLPPGLEKMCLDLKRRLEFPPGLCKTLKSVCWSCQVWHAVKPPNRSQAGNADCIPVPDVPMESVAIDKFAMPPVRHGKEVYGSVILCVDRRTGQGPDGTGGCPPDDQPLAYGVRHTQGHLE